MRFGIYKDDVDGFIICIQVYIPERNEKVLKLAHLNAQQGKTPDYNDYLDISPNFRKLTKDDFMKIALHDSCYVVFDILVRIYRGRHEVKNMREVEEGKDDDLKFTKNAYKARNALFFLKPDGMTILDFKDIIKEVDQATSSVREAYRKRD